ncbi:MAG: TraB/GumN family protein [Saprospiraceae bacterium]|nr:TraB/GumN family protein [Saprospiraceae bacterium]
MGFRNFYQIVNKYFNLNTWLLLTITCIIGSKPISAQTLSKINVDIVQPEESLLWKIEGKGLSKPSYLFGTIHLIPEDKYFFTKEMENAFAQSDQVIFEIDLNVMNDMSQMAAILVKMRMPDSVSLQDLISPEDYSLLQEKAKDSGMPLFMFENIKPLFLQTLLDDVNSQKSQMASYEINLAQKASNTGKGIGGLETIDDQMAAIDAVPLKEQAAMLMESLKSPDSQNIDTLIQLYEQQKIQELHDMIESSFAQSKDNYMDSFLKNRNVKWIDNMKRLMSEKSTFFAVGAGHLAGKSGVINLLREKGYKVTAIK